MRTLTEIPDGVKIDRLYATIHHLPFEVIPRVGRDGGRKNIMIIKRDGGWVIKIDRARAELRRDLFLVEREIMEGTNRPEDKSLTDGEPRKATHGSSEQENRWRTVIGSYGMNGTSH